MSVNCIIAKKIGRDKYRAVFCKYQGYLSDNGRILSENYNTPKKIDKLLALGDIYFLGQCPSKLEQKEPWESVTVAYGRDKGEKDCEAKEYTLEELRDLEMPYLYIFVKTNKWVYSGDGELESKFRDVKKALRFLDDLDSGELLLKGCKRATDHVDSETGPPLKL